MPDNERKWALVTGATGGLGQAFCEALAKRGYNLVLSARHLDALEALAGRLRSAHGVDVLAEAADLAEPNSARAVKSAIDARGIAVETLINNAGHAIRAGAQSIMMKPEPVVEIGLKALYAGKASVVAGAFNRVIAFSTRLAPRILQARVAAVFMGARK